MSSDGQMLTASFMDYQMPRAHELPDFRLATREVPTKVNPLGAKGVGEAGTVGAMAAVMNAVNDALAPLGIRHFDMPAIRDGCGRRSTPRHPQQHQHDDRTANSDRHAVNIQAVDLVVAEQGHDLAADHRADHARVRCSAENPDRGGRSGDTRDIRRSGRE